MEQSRQCVRLAATEGGDKLQDPVACASGEARQDILQKRPEAAGQVGGAKEMLRISVDRWDVGIPIRKGTQVQCKDVFREVLGNDIGV